MTAIACSSGTAKTLADGTLRIFFDFEPMYKDDAFRLFGTHQVHRQQSQLYRSAMQRSRS
jgi:hypothetical protein